MSTAAQGNANVSQANSQPVRTIFFGDYAAADEGSYFTAWLGATANTAVATTTQALASTSPSVVIFNGNPAGGYNIYMRTLKVRMTVVTTGTTTVEHIGVLNPNTGAQTTVGTAFNAPNNVNSASGTASKAALYGGVNVMATPGAGSRIVHTGPVTAIIPIVLDQWQFTYGDVGQGNTFGTVIGTTGSSVSVNLPPVIIAPQWFYTIGFWGASWAASAPTYRLDVGYIERPSGQ
jgi:hypothetical protein